MGIYPRLFIPVFFLVTVAFSVRYTVIFQSETAYANAQYQTDAMQLAHYLAATLEPLAAQHDSATAKAILGSVIVLSKDLVAINLEHGKTGIDYRNPHPVAPLYPGWFGKLTRIDTLRFDFPISSVMVGDGRLRLIYSPVVPLNRIWLSLRKQALISMIIISVFLLGLAALVAAKRNTLSRFAGVAERFRQGEYAVRMAPGRTPEARALAATFNHMASAVENLMSSLRTSQSRLDEQLAQTSEMQKGMQQASWQNYHDVLTGLPNRAALASRFEQEMYLARERRRMLAVCLFDLDHFQNINARIGPEAGDELLKQAAARLHTFADQRHYVARLGGDEFVLLLSGQDNLAAIERHVDQLLRQLNQPYQYEQQQLALSLSAGVAIYAGKDVSAETLLRHADQALYQAKLTGRSKMHIFDAGLDEEVRTHHTRRSEVRQALLARELRLYYQPKIDMRGGAIVGMEALLRWQHPQKGIVMPGQFLPLVEHTDLIIDIGEWVLRQALAQMQLWSRAGRRWVVSVNIAARHFQMPDFVPRLTHILSAYPDAEAAMLELEILESSALHDIEHVRRIMMECQQLGITFALDDFGTGYSSMAYLKRLPANVLKIDQSFVRNMLHDQDDLHLVGAVIGLARSFNLSVIAEGVETIEHGTALMRLGCDLAQGYGIARPMPAEAVQPWAASFSAAPNWRPVLAHES
ncbi:MAG: EAL domain-containing protein [Pseudomonadota bacterium]